MCTITFSPYSKCYSDDDSLQLYTGIQLSFSPSPNITLHQRAIYKCSVDHHGISVQWTINGTVSTDSSIADLGVVTHGVAELKSNLTIPGQLELNNTIVTCIASGLVNGNLFLKTQNVTLFIQGKTSNLLT